MKYQNRQKPSLEAWDKIRTGLLGELINSGMPKEDAVSFLVAAEEIYVNIVEHGYPGGITENAVCETGLIILNDGKRKQAVIVFRDNGMAFDPLSVPEREPINSVKGIRPGGFGISMAREKTDAMDYTRDGEYNVMSQKKQITQQIS